MNYWLVKSEPSAYAFSDMQRDKKTNWNGVRNFQANNYLKAMKKGDKCFFYHSNEQRAIVGIVKVVGEFYLDKKDETGRFGMVDVGFDQPLKNPVSLTMIKSNPALKDIALIKQSRLSVMPVTSVQWNEILKMAK